MESDTVRILKDIGEDILTDKTKRKEIMALIELPKENTLYWAKNRYKIRTKIIKKEYDPYEELQKRLESGDHDEMQKILNFSHNSLGLALIDIDPKSACDFRGLTYDEKTYNKEHVKNTPVKKFKDFF